MELFNKYDFDNSILPMKMQMKRIQEIISQTLTDCTVYFIIIDKKDKI